MTSRVRQYSKTGSRLTGHSGVTAVTLCERSSGPEGCYKTTPYRLSDYLDDNRDDNVGLMGVKAAIHVTREHTDDIHCAPHIRHDIRAQPHVKRVRSPHATTPASAAPRHAYPALRGEPGPCQIWLHLEPVARAPLHSREIYQSLPIDHIESRVPGGEKGPMISPE